ncbi:peptidoglycan-binding protein [Sphingomonas sp. ac-8]|uniref:peptidoglycan-binding protein n=1 Tax=Sphingomonas sp. ac-8 TaxID=3242977 RepID=UPI003A7FD94F
MVRSLRIGSRGDQVRALQTMLKRYQPDLKPDGIYGPATERAVRAYQRRAGLYPPDGIAGPRTMGALTQGSTGSSRTVPAAPASASRSPGALGPAVNGARQRATTGAAPRGQASPVAEMHISRLGRKFIFDHEAQRGVSNRLHHPTSGSGVTIGAGYDMKDRSAASIQRDLEAVQVPTASARAAAQGAGLSGSQATAFVRNNRDVLNLTEAQQQQLIVHVAPHYEAIVKRRIRVPLHQHEFDALVSYVYNPGGGWPTTARLVNEGRGHDAMVEIKRHVTSRGQRVASLVRRRDAEARMFLYGEYA